MTTHTAHVRMILMLGMTLGCMLSGWTGRAQPLYVMQNALVHDC